jgi:hypothetical protein
MGLMVAKTDGIIQLADRSQWRTYRGRSLADSAHPIVTEHPNSWMPMHVEFEVESSDEWDPARAGNGTPEIAPDEAEYAEQFRRLAAAARDLDVLTDGPLTAAEVVEQVVAILDEWKRQPIEVPAAREDIRQWAKDQGMEVADKGRLPQAVVDAHAAAHRVE